MTASTDRHAAGAAPASAAREDAEDRSPVWVLRDTWAITRRNLQTTTRQPELLVFVTIQPVIFILLFRFVFGGAITAPGPVDYVDYLLTGIFVQTITFGAVQTGIGLAEDTSRGIVDRFKSLPIARSAVLAGRIGADLVRNVGITLVMVGVGYLVGFRFSNGLTGAVLAVLLLLLWGLAFSWLGAWLGLTLKTPETVQAASFPLLFPLVFASSIFVPVETMPGWLQAFVKVNPITLVTDAVRALAIGEPFELLPDLWWSLLSIGVVLVVFVPLAVRRYRRT